MGLSVGEGVVGYLLGLADGLAREWQWDPQWESLSGGSISSLSQSTGKKRAPPTKVKSQNNTRQRLRTKNKTASKASKRKTDYKRADDDVDDDDNTDDDDKDYNKDDDEFS